jgi:hypothetical protein
VQGIPPSRRSRTAESSRVRGSALAVAVSSFLDELLAPPRVPGLVDELRGRRAPEVCAALEGTCEQALDLLVSDIPGASPERRERCVGWLAVFEDLGHGIPDDHHRRRLATALY